MRSSSFPAAVHTISPGVANAFLIETDELVLIDTGSAGSLPNITAAVRNIGRELADIHHILVTHCHADHAGGLAELIPPLLIALTKPNRDGGW